MSRALSRSAARLAAVQALYQREMEKTPIARLLHEFHQHRLGATIDDRTYADAEVDFFDDIVKGVDARQEEIDTVIAANLGSGSQSAVAPPTMMRSGARKRATASPITSVSTQ